MSSFCKNCLKVYKKNENKDNKCSCGSDLKYLGTCGECLDFIEYYDGLGTCKIKDKVKKNNKGCYSFK